MYCRSTLATLLGAPRSVAGYPDAVLARSAVSRITPSASSTGCATRAATGVQLSLSGSMRSASGPGAAGKGRKLRLIEMSWLLDAADAASTVPAPLPVAPMRPARTVYVSDTARGPSGVALSASGAKPARGSARPSAGETNGPGYRFVRLLATSANVPTRSGAAMPALSTVYAGSRFGLFAAV